jgi:hypothetical protein
MQIVPLDSVLHFDLYAAILGSLLLYLLLSPNYTPLLRSRSSLTRACFPADLFAN